MATWSWENRERYWLYFKARSRGWCGLSPLSFSDWNEQQEREREEKMRLTRKAHEDLAYFTHIARTLGLDGIPLPQSWQEEILASAFGATDLLLTGNLFIRKRQYYDSIHRITPTIRRLGERERTAQETEEQRLREYLAGISKQFNTWSYSTLKPITGTEVVPGTWGYYE